MEHLAELIAQLGFDLREFERILYRTQSWQREAGLSVERPLRLRLAPVALVVAKKR